VSGDALRGPAPHAFVSDLDAPVLDPVDRHHIERVLRLRAGDRLTVSDGAGAWRACRFGPELTVDGERHALDRPAPRLTVGFALVKGERPELIVQKLTELGIDEIVVFRAARSVVRWDAARADRHGDRLRRVAREAAMQSRRCWLPEVVLTGDVRDAAAQAGTGQVALAEQGGGPPSATTTALLVGPEGGWSDEERLQVAAKVGLGDHVLRVETAAIAAGVVLAAMRSGWLKPAGSAGGV
jgi:16S rRNA (uracil1498-N3)-methyltransferase